FLFTVLIFWFAPPYLVKFAGSEYTDTVPLLRLQLIVISILLLCNPVSLVLVAMGKVRNLAILNLVQLAVDLLLDFWWIPKHGAYGAVAATLAVNVVGLIYVNYAVWQLVRHHRKAENKQLHRKEHH